MRPHLFLWIIILLFIDLNGSNKSIKHEYNDFQISLKLIKFSDLYLYLYLSNEYITYMSKKNIIFFPNRNTCV